MAREDLTMKIIYANQVDVTSAPFICAILDRAVSRLDVYCLSGQRMGSASTATIGRV